MSKNNSGKRFLLGIAVASLLPLSFYFIVSEMLSRHKMHLPYYYIGEGVTRQMVNGKMETDTVFHQVKDITLTNQLGKTISLNNTLKGKVLVIDFFFVNCPTVCPRLTKNMHFLQRAFKRDPKSEYPLDSFVQFVSITVNPEHDSVPVLRAYADRYGANHDHWWFLTGDKKDIYNFARNELFVAAPTGDGGADDFIHTEKIVVLDKERYIRGYYNGLDSGEIKRCADDIVLLVLEKEKKVKKNKW